MTLIVVGSVALDSIHHPVRRDRRRAGWFVRCTSASPGRCCTGSTSSASSATTTRWPNSTGWRRAGSTGRAWSARRARASAGRGKYSYDLQSRETLETRLGVFAAFQPKIPAALHAAKFVFLGNIDPELQIGVLDQVASPALVVCDTMNYWIQSTKPDTDEAAQAGGHPDGQRRRGARAVGRLEHPPRGALDPRRTARSASSSSRASSARCSSSPAAPSTCPPIRWRKCSTRPAPATHSRAASWGIWRGPARPTASTCAARWCTARRWDRSRCPSSDIKGFDDVTTVDVEKRVRAFHDLTHVAAGGTGPVTRPAEPRQYAAAGVDLADAETAKERIGRLVAGTRTPLTVGRVGAFGGMVRVPRRHADPDAGHEHRRRRHQGAGRAAGGALRHRRRVTSSTTASTTSWSTGRGRSRSWTTSPAPALGIEMLADIVEGVARGCRAHGMDARRRRNGADARALRARTLRPGRHHRRRRRGGRGAARRCRRAGRRAPRLRVDGAPHQRLHPRARKIAAQDLGLGIHDDAGPASDRRSRTRFSPCTAATRGRSRRCSTGCTRSPTSPVAAFAGNLIRVLPGGCTAVVDSGSWEWPAALPPDAGGRQGLHRRDARRLQPRGGSDCRVAAGCGRGGAGRGVGGWREDLGDGPRRGRCPGRPVRQLAGMSHPP